jgi:hypothetical protein
MSEKILKALLQLFAIIAKGDAVGEGARPDNAAPLERFLRKQFSPEVAAGHMARYQAFVLAFPRQWRSKAEVAASAHRSIR